MTAFSERERFQHWLMAMDDAIDRFITLMPPDTKKLMDGTPSSLDALEAQLLSNFVSPAQVRAPDQTKFVDGAARYLGEIYRIGSQSQWTLDLENKDAVFYRIPALRGGFLKAPLCPLTTISACTDRRTGTFLSTIFKNVCKQSS
jgi:hypothetical protein